MMDIPLGNLDGLHLVVFGIGPVSALAVTSVLVTWLKQLLDLEGQAVRWLTAGVAVYVVASLYAMAYQPTIGVLLTLPFVAALLALGADALHAQQTRRAAQQKEETDD
ncbi:MAG TPA: hypothetical protein VK052_06650 [Zeimonas sp.]|nr:hypothetical protein [Zeimonas sp.]